MIGSRIALAIPVLFIITAFSFVLVSFIPGNVATTILGQNATPESIRALNDQLGLNTPLPEQYLGWLSAAFRGDLGTSIFTGDDVASTVFDRVMPTLYVAGFATLVAAVLGIALGTMAAVRGGAVARALDVLGMVGMSLPNFWFALILIVFVSGRLGWFPSLGYTDPSVDASIWLSQLVLPVTALAIAGVALIAKQTRDALVEAMSRDFMRFMQANGISRRSLVFRHGLRYSATSIVSGISSSFINLFGGTVALETIFAIPGLGSLVTTATLQHDLPTVQGTVLAYTIVILIVTLLADIGYRWLDRKAAIR
ncbi:ABC transporter permease [Rathayibacter soli]|uniref:ABC transporter permease n=1 Tax=Rathayibacter soli TaxID=3144168 RepID=UPI0027E3BA19|nr:ABC transporter permease [Glaciibacter superstes]